MTLRALMEEMRPPRVPAHMNLETIVLGGVEAERLTPPDAGFGRALLYIHGGGFVGGSPRTHRALTWRLAEKTGAAVYAIDYRLAPEHPFPAAVEDCVAAYRALIEAVGPGGAIAVGGDSAGGNLTLALGLMIKAQNLKKPSCLFCLSPATDLAGETESRSSNRRSDAMFDWRSFGSVTERYCPGRDPSEPLISPLRGDVAGFPPTQILCSAIEMLRDDGVLMGEKLRKSGVEVELEVWPKVFHAWPVTADIIPEARAAIDKIASFVARHWRAAPNA
jgi:acetyl esterase/lipase